MQTLSRRTIIKDIFKLSAPIALMSMIGFIASAGGILMLSHLGALEVAASALATTTVMTIGAMIGTTLMSVGIRTSFYRGQKADAETFVTILKSGFLLGFILSCIGAVLVWFGPQWLALFHRNADLIARTITYFHIAAIFMLLTSFFSVWVQYYNGMGNTMIGTWLSIIRLPIALICMYGFIFGKWGLPDLQLGGVILGQAIAVFVALIVLIIYTLRQPIGRLFFYQHIPFKQLVQQMQALFTLGWPIGIQYGGELAAMTVAVYMMGAFGANALAAQQIVSQYSMIIVMLALGISQAASILIAKVHGEENIHLGHRIMAMSVSCIVLLFMVLTIIVTVWGHAILQIFFNHNMHENSLIQHLSYQLLWVALVVMFFDSMRNVFAFGLRAIGFPKAPMMIGLVCLWLMGIPCAYLFGFKLLDDPIALRLGFCIGFVVCTLWLWQMWHHKMSLRLAEKPSL